MSSKPTQEVTVVSKEEMAMMGQSLPSVVTVGQKSRVMVLELPKEKGDMLTNFRHGNTEDEVAVSRAMSPCDGNLDIYVGKTIKVIGVVLNMAEFESDKGGGEMVGRVYASIVLEDGSVIGTTGKAVMGQLAYLVGSRVQGPFDPPAEYEVRQHDMPKQKKPYYSLRRILPAKAVKGKVVGNAS